MSSRFNIQRIHSYLNDTSPEDFEAAYALPTRPTSPWLETSQMNLPTPGEIQTGR